MMGLLKTKGLTFRLEALEAFINPPLEVKNIYLFRY